MVEDVIIDSSEWCADVFHGVPLRLGLFIASPRFVQMIYASCRSIRKTKSYSGCFVISRSQNIFFFSLLWWKSFY